MSFSVGLTLHDGLAVHVDDFISAQTFEVEGHFALGGVGINDHHVHDGHVILRDAFEGTVFKEVIADIDELTDIIGSFPGVAERSVGKFVPVIGRLRMIGHEHTVNGAGLIVGVVHAIDDLVVGEFFTTQAVAIGIKDSFNA